jgi:hypothetical protein
VVASAFDHFEVATVAPVGGGPPAAPATTPPPTVAPPPPAATWTPTAMPAPAAATWTPTVTPTPTTPAWTPTPTPVPTSTPAWTPTPAPAPTSTPAGAPTGVTTPAPGPAQARPDIVSVSGIPPSKKLANYSKFTVNTSDPAAVTKVEFRWSRACFPDYDDTTAPFFQDFFATICPDGPIALSVRLYDAQGLADDREFADLVVDNVPDATATPTRTATPTPAPTAPPSPTPLPTAAPIPVAAVLMDRYVNVQNQDPLDYDHTLYRPRQFNEGLVVADPTWGNFTVTDDGPYDGWDLFVSPNRGTNRVRAGDWMSLTVRRASRLALVWRGAPGAEPAWLVGAGSGWTAAAGVVVQRPTGQSRTYDVWTKDVPAGTVTLGAVRDTAGGSVQDTYWVLLAEAGGTPSTAPAVPPGQAAPAPNETCPAWMHDRFRTTLMGPETTTWHRQIDPNYWCYYRHEHGSDPAQLAPSDAPGWTPSFGRSALAQGIAENDQGFKGVYFEKDNHGWYLWMHFGTGNAVNAACQRLHEVGIAVVRLSDRKLMSDVAFMADFGKAVENTTGVPLSTVCVNQALTGGTGARRLPIYDGSQTPPGGQTMYEPWQPDFTGTVLGLEAIWFMNTPDPVAICTDMTCATNTVTGQAGARRFIDVPGGFGIKAARAGATGTFYTNGTGTQVVGQGAPGAVRQFISPEADFSFTYLGDNSTCYTSVGPQEAWDRFRARYVCDAGHPGGGFQGGPQTLERSLTSPN